jgi:hypothetical protein
MALDVVLHGVSAARLGTILATFHGESVNNMIASATEVENRARGADSWNQVKAQSLDRLSNIEVMFLLDISFSAKAGCFVHIVMSLVHFIIYLFISICDASVFMYAAF